MSDSSPILSLPYLMPSQAQKHVTHNEALQSLDVLVQLSVQGFDAETPPDPPVLGAVYALGASPSAAWAGQSSGTLAVWQGAAWQFITPLPGWRAWGLGDSELRVWDGSAWGAATALPETLPRLGIQTSADNSNRLAVSAAATLLSHEGGGHQLKINKSAPAETASVLFQSGWTGHAEFGLAGSTDFSIKLSPDGSSWSEALRFDATSGTATGTAVQSDPLDTTPGRFLPVGAFGLGASQDPPEISDFANLSASGLYRYQGGGSGAGDNPDPDTHDGAALVLAGAGQDQAMLALRNSQAGSVRGWLGSQASGEAAPSWGEMALLDSDGLNGTDIGLTTPGEAVFDLLGIGTGANDCSVLIRKNDDCALRMARPDQSGEVIVSFDPSSNGAGVRDAQIRALQGPGNTQVGLAFYTANATTPAEAMRLDRLGNVAIGTDTSNGRLAVDNASNSPCLAALNTHASLSSAVIQASANKAGAADFDLFLGQSNLGASADTEARISGDGNGFCDGSWSGGGADYAEYFEWLDGNPLAEDRRGLAVVLEAGKIRAAQAGEDPVGVISATPSVIGDGDMDRWKGKYLRDAFGAYLWRDLPDPDAPDGPPQRARVLNPAYDPGQPYVPRAARAEWDLVGLLGKLRLRSGQPVGPRWIRLRGVSDEIEEWLLR